jgi:hypothetical protein
MRGLTEIVTGTSTTPAEEATDRSPATKILTQSVWLLDILDQAVVSAGIFADASLPSVVETTKFADRAYKALADMAAKAPGGRAAIPARSHKKYGGEYDYWYRAMDRVAGDDGDDVSRMLMTMRAATQDDDTWTWADKMLNIVGGIKEHARGAGFAYDRDKKKANVTVNLRTQTAQVESIAVMSDADRVLSEALKPVAAAAAGPAAERQKIASQAQAGIEKMLQALDMVRQWVSSLGIGKSDKTGAAAAALKAASAELKGATAEEVQAILAVIDEAKKAKPSEDAMKAMDGLTRLVDGLRTLQGMMRQAKVGQGILDKLDAAIAGLKATRDFIHQAAAGGAPATESKEGEMRGSWLTSALSEAQEQPKRFPEGVMTEKEWVSKYAHSVEAVTVSWRSLINKKKWNAMDGDEQKEYEAGLKKRAEKPEYRAWRSADKDVFQVISKATYDHAKSNGIKAESVGGGLAEAMALDDDVKGAVNDFVLTTILEMNQIGRAVDSVKKKAAGKQPKLDAALDKIEAKRVAMRNEVVKLGGAAGIGTVRRSEGVELVSCGLSEALDDSAIASLSSRLAKLTDQNAHTDAYLLVAQTVFPSNKRLTGAWQALKTLIDFRGGVDGALRPLRDRMYDELMAGLKSNLSPDQYQAIYGAL